MTGESHAVFLAWPRGGRREAPRLLVNQVVSARPERSRDRAGREMEGVPQSPRRIARVRTRPTPAAPRLARAPQLCWRGDSTPGSCKWPPGSREEGSLQPSDGHFTLGRKTSSSCQPCLLPLSGKLPAPRLVAAVTLPATHTTILHIRRCRVAEISSRS